MANSFITKLSAILTPLNITISDIEIEGNETHATISKGDIKRYVTSGVTKYDCDDLDPRLIEELENDSMDAFVKELLKNFQ